MDEVKRPGACQAAPLARKKRTVQPKRLKRKKGKFCYRREPAPEDVSETKKARLQDCVSCQSVYVLTQRVPSSFQGGVGQSLPKRIKRRLGSVGQVQLAQYVANVGSHRPLADYQFFGDLPVGQTPRHQAQDLHFAP